MVTMGHGMAGWLASADLGGRRRYDCYSQDLSAEDPGKTTRDERHPVWGKDAEQAGELCDAHVLGKYGGRSATKREGAEPLGRRGFVRGEGFEESLDWLRR